MKMILKLCCKLCCIPTCRAVHLRIQYAGCGKSSKTNMCTYSMCTYSMDTPQSCSRAIFQRNEGRHIWKGGLLEMVNEKPYTCIKCGCTILELAKMQEPTTCNEDLIHPKDAVRVGQSHGACPRILEGSGVKLLQNKHLIVKLMRNNLNF